MRRHLRPLIVLYVLCSACGGGGNSPDTPEPPPGTSSPPPSGPPPGTTVLRGGERLGWDQTGVSLAAVQGYTFALYVDGVRSALGDVRCAAAGGGAGFPCSGLLPPLSNGTHTLEIAAIDRGVEGPTSAPLTVMMAASVAPALTSVMPAGAAIVCIDQALAECFDAEPIATGVGEVTDFVEAAGDLAFYVEDGTSVRLVRGGAVAASPALAAPDGTRLVSLAVAPTFAATRHVFVGSVHERTDSNVEFTVTRYREVGGLLGEPLPLASLPAGAATRVPIGADAEENVYVALPKAPDDRRHLSEYAYNGSVLRFDAEGRTPADQSSPVLSRGYPLPSGLVHDGATQRVWLAGTGFETRHAAVIMLGNDPRSAQLRVLSETGTTPPGGAQERPALTLGPSQESRDLWLTDGELFRAATQDGATLSWQRVPTAFGRVSSVATYGGGLVLVVQNDPASAAGVFDIVRLVARKGHDPR